VLSFRVHGKTCTIDIPVTSYGIDNQHKKSKFKPLKPQNNGNNSTKPAKKYGKTGNGSKGKTCEGYRHGMGLWKIYIPAV